MRIVTTKAQSFCTLGKGLGTWFTQDSVLGYQSSAMTSSFILDRSRLSNLDGSIVIEGQRKDGQALRVVTRGYTV